MPVPTENRGDRGQLNFDLPKDVRLMFTEARASISRRAGERIHSDRAFEVLVKVYLALQEPQATGLVQAAVGRTVPGRFR